MIVVFAKKMWVIIIEYQAVIIDLQIREKGEKL